MIVIVDYGMGNLRSVSKALESLGAEVRVSSLPEDVGRAEKVILPGVGAFPAAMRELAARRLIEPIKVAIESGKPYLGICLGLQLLFEYGEEGEGAAGFGVLKGRVRRFAFDSALRTPHSALKIPHMGWNQISTQHPPHGVADPPSRVAGTAHSTQTCPLLTNIPDSSFFYFVHSYYGDPVDRSVIAGETEYGSRFASMVWRKNLYATQFHPEKSQAVGLQLLKNFISL
ncbi:MAG: imidazole glycerol phosphate synthase subunit HisH [Candidatus Omnitrophica bacterium]|nr:imidazole glycerol phosphate synthase subunit HisH [Candidatus Omnitrophota bacterium]